MNIYSPEGTKVVFQRPQSGLPEQVETAAKHLKLGSMYTVERVERHEFFTDVYLEEVPGIGFNSVMFEEVDYNGL